MTQRFTENLPTELVSHVKAGCGAAGEIWLSQLQSVIRRLEKSWSISVNDPFPAIEYNFVAPATRSNGERVVIKIAPPWDPVEIHGEAKFLRTEDGNGAVRLLAENSQARALLIERAVPGRSLVELFAADPLRSVQPALEVLKAITKPPPDDMTDVTALDQWFANFRDRYSGTAFPSLEAERALTMYDELTSVRSDLRYIHGDFHLGNIVDSERLPFLAIDPKGIVGHVGYEAAVFLINLYRWQKENDRIEDILDDAVCAFAAGLGMSEKNIRQWGFVHTVIGAWWNFDDMPDLYDAELAMPDIWDV